MGASVSALAEEDTRTIMRVEILDRYRVLLLFLWTFVLNAP